MTTRRRWAIAAISGGVLLALGIREAFILKDADDGTARTRARQLGATRIAAGVALLLRPQLLTGVLGIDQDGAAAGWLPRLLAVREIGLGIGACASSRTDADPWPWLITIGAVDGAEAVVLLGALRQHGVDLPGGWAFTAADLGSASAVVLRAANLRSGVGRKDAMIDSVSSAGPALPLGAGQGRVRRARGGRSRLAYGRGCCAVPGVGRLACGTGRPWF